MFLNHIVATPALILLMKTQVKATSSCAMEGCFSKNSLLLPRQSI